MLNAEKNLMYFPTFDNPDSVATASESGRRLPGSWDFPRPLLARQQVFFIQPWREAVDGAKAVIDLTDLGFILTGMAEESPRHNALPLSRCITTFSRVSSIAHFKPEGR